MLKNISFGATKALFVFVLSLIFGCSGAQKTTQINYEVEKSDSISTSKDEVIKEIEKEDAIIDSLALAYPLNLKEQYNITYLLPLFLNEYPNLSSSHKFLAEVALAFWWGAQLALDTLKNAGFNAKVNVLDTENDTTVLKRKINELTDSQHLFFGPLFPSNLSVLNKFSKEQNVNIISPLATVDACNDFNDRMIFSKPNINEINKATADFITAKFDSLYNIFIYCRAIDYEQKEAQSIYNALPKRIQKRVKIDEINKNYVDKNYLRGKVGDSAVVIICSDKESFVTTVIAELRRALGNYYVIGREPWIDFQSMDAEAWARLNMHFMCTQNLNYSDTLLKPFLRKYRKKYQTEPSKYAIAGYYETIYYCLYLNTYGTNFQRFKNELDFKLPYLDINLIQNQECKYFFNSQVKILTFKDHQLIELE